jgi:hypothetical protein
MVVAGSVQPNYKKEKRFSRWRGSESPCVTSPDRTVFPGIEYEPTIAYNKKHSHPLRLSRSGAKRFIILADHSNRLGL